jgi:hypothetical protein
MSQGERVLRVSAQEKGNNVGDDGMQMWQIPQRKLMDYKKFGESTRAGEAELEALRQTILKMRDEGQSMGAIQDKFRGTALDGLDETALDKFCAADTLEKKVTWAVATF